MKNLFYLLLTCYLCSCQSKPGENNQSLTKASIVYSPQFPRLTDAEIAHYNRLVNNYFDSTHFLNSFNGSILIAKNGTIVYERYNGYRNPKLKDTLTAETPSQIASTTKTFTGIAALQLVQQGKLNLDDPLTKFFPGFPYSDVTVKMLLNHRSGLPEYLYYFEKNGWDRKTYATNADVVNTLMTWQPPKASRANTRFDYCNTNFVLLASVIEKVSTLSFPEYLRQNIFEPLGMENTYVFSPADTARATQSFDWHGGIWQMDFSDGPYGDKNIHSTVRDLLKWDQALYTNQLVNKQLLDSAFTSYSNERKTQHNYGLGWRILEFENGKKVVYHNGRWHGFNSAFSRLTDEKVTIIILTNKFNRGVYSTARKLYNLFGNYDKHSDSVE